MKSKLTKQQAQEKISQFFERESFTNSELIKIKRLAMKFKIKLKENRKKFCKKCLLPLKGKTRISKTHKTVICQNCGYKNKFKILV